MARTMLPNSASCCSAPNHLGFANFTDGVPVCSIPGLPRQGGGIASGRQLAQGVTP